MLWVLIGGSQLDSFLCPHFWARCLMLATVTYRYRLPVIEWLVKIYLRFLRFFFKIQKTWLFTFFELLHTFSRILDLISLLTLLLCFFLFFFFSFFLFFLLERLLQRSPRLRRFKWDLDDIWQDWSSNKYASKCSTFEMWRDFYWSFTLLKFYYWLCFMSVKEIIFNICHYLMKLRLS